MGPYPTQPDISSSSQGRTQSYPEWVRPLPQLIWKSALRLLVLKPNRTSSSDSPQQVCVNAMETSGSKTAPLGAAAVMGGQEATLS